MPSEKSDMMASWLVLTRYHKDESDVLGTLVHAEERHNLIVDIGRRDALRELFIPASAIDFQFLGVGSSNTAAAAGDTTLAAEITLASIPAGSLASRPTLTNTSAAPLSNSDIVADVSVSPYREKIIVQQIYATTDNNGTTFYEFGLFSAATFGSGDMFNRFVLGSPISKTSSISVVVQITIRM